MPVLGQCGVHLELSSKDPQNHGDYLDSSTVHIICDWGFGGLLTFFNFRLAWMYVPCPGMRYTRINSLYLLADL